MISCQSCEHNPTGERCELFGRVIGMHGCSSGVERKPRNHFEMVKSMSMEELAKWIYSIQDEDTFRKENYLQPLSKERWLTWLKEAIE